MLNEYLNWIVNHPSYSDNTKEVYGTLVSSDIFKSFFNLFLTSPEQAELLIREKSLSTRQQYFKVAKRILERNAMSIPGDKPTRFRISSAKPLYPAEERIGIESWNDLIGFIERVESAEWRLIFKVAAYTGCRAGELYSLRPQSIKAGLLQVAHNYCFKTGNYSVPKNGRTRKVPIALELRAILRERMDQEWLLPRPKEFTGGHQSTVLRRYCERHGYSPIKFHTIRALFAKKLRTEGVSITTVMDICGWESYETADRYNKEAGADLVAAAKALEGALGNGSQEILGPSLQGNQ